MGPRARAVVAGLVLAAVLAAGAVASSRLRVGTDVAQLVPDDAERRVAGFVRVLAQSELAKTVVLSVHGTDESETLGATRALGNALRSAPEVAWMRAGVGPDTERVVRELYFPRRAELAFTTNEEARDELGEEGLRAAARTLRSELALPTAPLVRAVASEDPLLVFPRFVRALTRLGDGLQTRDGVLLTADGAFGLVVLGTRSSPFDGPAASRFVVQLGRAMDSVRRAFPRADIEQSALHRYAVEAEASVKRDIVRVSVGSTVLVALLLFGVLRPRSALLVWVPVAFGMAVAFVITTLLFGAVHGLTLAFGTTLVGITGDFGIHLLGSHALSNDPSIAATRARVWPGIQLGGVTTIAGLAGLGATSFPGMREMAVFASAGVLGALAATYWIVPAFSADTPKPTPLARRLSVWASRALDAAIARRRVSTVVALGVVALCSAGMFRLRWVGSLAALTERSAATVAEDERVRARVARLDGGLVVVSEGATEEDALVASERALPRLERAVRDGAIDGFRSVNVVMRSVAAQRASLAALQDPSLPARLDRAFVAEGFVPGGFGRFFESLHGARPAPLTHGALAASPLADLVRPFRVEDRAAHRVLYLAYVRGLHDAARLESALRGVPGVSLLDQPQLLSRAYGRYRDRTLQMTALGMLVVAALVYARYRKLRLVLGAVLPAVLAGGAALGVVGWLGDAANLLHVMGLLLVLSMGVDYGIYMTEHRAESAERAASTLSVMLAALTTVLSFGLLAFSSSPALRSLGVVSTVGLLCAMLLAPLGMALVGDDPRKP